MRGSDLGIVWIGILCGLALLLAFATVLVNHDAEVVRAALVIGGIASTGVGGLVGYIGGYHAGKAEGANQVPDKPTVS